MSTPTPLLEMRLPAWGVVWVKRLPTPGVMTSLAPARAPADQVGERRSGDGNADRVRQRRRCR